MNEIDRAREAFKQNQGPAQSEDAQAEAQHGPGNSRDAHTWEPPGDPARTSGDTDADTVSVAAAGAAAKGGDLPNTTTKPKQGAASAWSALDVRASDFDKVQPGFAVFSSDGEELGKVTELGPNWFALLYGRTLERTMYVPITYLETVTNTRVVLNQPAGLLIDMKLNEPPPEGEADGRERLAGIEHEPRRAQPGDATAIAESPEYPAQLPVQQSSTGASEPPGSDNRTPTASGAGQTTHAVSAPMEAASPTPAVGREIGERSERSVITEGDRARSDAALQPAEPERYPLGSYDPVARTVDAGAVARATSPMGSIAAHTSVSSHMEPSRLTAEGAATGQVSPRDRSDAGFEHSSGYIVESSGRSYDQPDGPTHQSGVRDPRSLEPLRTPFGSTGTPGAPEERNVFDTDLTKNRHPDGDPFGSQVATVGRPLSPGEPQAAHRSLPDAEGLAQPPAAPQVADNPTSG